MVRIVFFSRDGSVRTGFWIELKAQRLRSIGFGGVAFIIGIFEVIRGPQNGSGLRYCYRFAFRFVFPKAQKQ